MAETRSQSAVEGRRVPLYSMYRGPGPAYKLKTVIGAHDHCQTKRQAPAWSIGSKYKSEYIDSPGPIYGVDPTVTAYGKHQVRVCTLSGRLRSKPIEILPGPGAYDVRPVREGTMVSMGARTWKPKNEVPPPNAYNVKTGIGANSLTEKRIPSCTLRGRQPPGAPQYPTIKAAVPGPASYNIPDPRVVVPSFGKKYPRVEYDSSKGNPGPGTYYPERATQSAGSKGRSMGIRHSPYVMPLISFTDITF